MEQFDFQDIQAWMDSETLPQMLFEGQKLRLVNQSLCRIWPQAAEGLSAEQVFGPAADVFSTFAGKGSIVFSGELAGADRDFQLTLWRGFYRVTVLADQREAIDASMEMTARSILTPLSNIMAVTPKIMPKLAESEDPKIIKRAAELNHELYSLMRVAGHLRTCSGSLRFDLRRNPQNLTVWLSQLAEELIPLAKTADRVLELKLPTNGIMCEIDKDRLKHALLNLISNAIKFTMPGGHIELEMKEAGGNRLCIIIRDDGCGMAPSAMGTLFNLGNSQQLIPDPRQGAGMGLPIARAIVRAHQGNLLLESQEGKGTTVYLYLQRAGRSRDFELRSDVKYPVPFGGISDVLIELADVLPSSVFDVKDIYG